MQEIAELYQRCRAQAQAALNSSNQGKDQFQLQLALQAIENWRQYVRGHVDPVAAVGFDAVQQPPTAPLNWQLGVPLSCYTEFLKMERQMKWLVQQHYAGRVQVTVTGDNNRVNTAGNDLRQGEINIERNENSPIQQGVNSEQNQEVAFEMPPVDDLRHLVELMRAHLGELELSSEQKRAAEAQIATLDAQLIDEPNPAIVKEAGRSLKNITEGAIGSLLANAAQPGIWGAIQSMLTWF